MYIIIVYYTSQWLQSVNHTYGWLYSIPLYCTVFSITDDCIMYNIPLNNYIVYITPLDDYIEYNISLDDCRVYFTTGWLNGLYITSGALNDPWLRSAGSPEGVVSSSW